MLKGSLKRGFTLIEMIIVVALIGILSITIAPKLTNQVSKAKDAQVIALLSSLRTNGNIFFAENGEDILEYYDEDSESALTDLVLNLDEESLTLFNGGEGLISENRYDDSGRIDRAFTKEELEVEAGGIRVTPRGDISSGNLEFDFIERGTTTTKIVVKPVDSSRGEYDTKGKKWEEY